MSAVATMVECEGKSHARRGREAPVQEACREANQSWGYLVHPALLPTVFAPEPKAQEQANGEETAARKV